MATTKWALDPTHSEIGFKIRHMMITNVSGGFSSFTAEASTEEEDFSTAQISFSADIASINTNNEQRDTHLRSADFFDAENHPNLVFNSSALKPINGDEYEVSGTLSIKGIEQPVTLKAVLGGIGKDPWGNTKAGFSLEGKINRKDFGLTWNAPIEAGGVLVSDEVKLYGEVQFVKAS